MCKKDAKIIHTFFKSFFFNYFEFLTHSIVKQLLGKKMQFVGVTIHLESLLKFKI